MNEQSVKKAKGESGPKGRSIVLGAGAGLIFGSAFGSAGAGLVLGAALGVFFGRALERMLK